MSELETSLHLLQNKSRRVILELLVREPHYPLQLAQRLDLSQQAIMKHLKLLEKAGFVVSMNVPSEKGGPPKNIYSVQESISIRIDLGPDMFRCENRRLPAGGPMRLSGRLPEDCIRVAEAVSGRKKIPFGEGMVHLNDITQSLEDLDRKRDAMIALHQQVKHRIAAAVDSDFEEYEQRALIHTMMESPGEMADLRAVIKELQLDTLHAEDLIERVRERVMRQLAERGGQVISAPQGSSLPWWIALGGEER